MRAKFLILHTKKNRGSFLGNFLPDATASRIGEIISQASFIIGSLRFLEINKFSKIAAVAIMFVWLVVHII
jgi:hypothetical protein